MTLSTQAGLDGLRPVDIDRTELLPAYDGLEQTNVIMMSLWGDVCEEVQEELA